MALGFRASRAFCAGCKMREAASSNCKHLAFTTHLSAPNTHLNSPVLQTFALAYGRGPSACAASPEELRVRCRCRAGIAGLLVSCFRDFRRLDVGSQRLRVEGKSCRPPFLLGWL